MRAFVLTALIAAGVATATASTASAQVGVRVGPHGAAVYVNPGHGHRGPPPRVYNDNWRVSRNEAVNIARRNGMARIFDVQRTPRAWVVRGVNFRGRNVAMRIDRDGRWSW